MTAVVYRVAFAFWCGWLACEAVLIPTKQPEMALALGAATMWGVFTISSYLILMIREERTRKVER